MDHLEVWGGKAEHPRVKRGRETYHVENRNCSHVAGHERVCRGGPDDDRVGGYGRRVRASDQNGVVPVTIPLTPGQQFTLNLGIAPDGQDAINGIDITTYRDTQVDPQTGLLTFVSPNLFTLVSTTVPDTNTVLTSPLSLTTARPVALENLGGHDLGYFKPTTVSVDGVTAAAPVAHRLPGREPRAEPRRRFDAGRSRADALPARPLVGFRVRRG